MLFSSCFCFLFLSLVSCLRMGDVGFSNKLPNFLLFFRFFCFSCCLGHDWIKMLDVAMNCQNLPRLSVSGSLICSWHRVREWDILHFFSTFFYISRVLIVLDLLFMDLVSRFVVSPLVSVVVDIAFTDRRSWIKKFLKWKKSNNNNSNNKNYDFLACEKISVIFIRL